MKLQSTLAIAWLGVASAENCKASCSGIGSEKICTFTSELDLFASETGYYRFKECGDTIMPTLEMERGATYRFVQNDDTNWMHPLGFAYFPDGAHEGVDELEPGITQTGSSCVADNTCQAPRYMINGEFAGTTYDNAALPAVGGDDFGLDVYEPLFAKSREEWQETREDSSGGYEVHLTLTDPLQTADMFYFCHIHTKMSGRIVVVDAAGNPVNPTPGAPALYSHYIPSAFDRTCGTFDTDGFQRGSGKCPNGNFMFCSDDNADDADHNAEGSNFNQCMYAMDCHMQHGMRTALSADPMAAFMHQMIPHHQNAVNMAKLLLKMGVDEAKDAEGEVESMLYNIVNVQNNQINMMRGWLAEHDHVSSTEAQCGSFSDEMYSPVCCSAAKRRLLFGSPKQVGCLCN